MDFNSILSSVQEIVVRQRRELTEILGFETRNKFSIETNDGSQIGYCSEQQKGFVGFFFRQFLGHWRSFDIYFFDANRHQVMTAVHPFRFYFERLEIYGENREKLGAIQHRFSVLNKCFDLLDSQGRVIMSVSSPIWKIWTFAFKKREREVAYVKKRWGGILKEALLDADSFTIEYSEQTLSLTERQLILAASIFIDLRYFERKS